MPGIRNVIMSMFVRFFVTPKNAEQIVTITERRGTRVLVN